MTVVMNGEDEATDVSTLTLGTVILPAASGFTGFTVNDVAVEDTASLVAYIYKDCTLDQYAAYQTSQKATLSQTLNDYVELRATSEDQDIVGFLAAVLADTDKYTVVKTEYSVEGTVGSASVTYRYETYNDDAEATEVLVAGAEASDKNGLYLAKGKEVTVTFGTAADANTALTEATGFVPAVFSVEGDFIAKSYDTSAMAVSDDFKDGVVSAKISGTVTATSAIIGSAKEGITNATTSIASTNITALAITGGSASAEMQVGPELDGKGAVAYSPVSIDDYSEFDAE